MNGEHDITIEQAAEFFKVSEHYVAKILDNGELPFKTVGSDRRIVLSQLMEYKRKRDVARSQALDELYRISEEAGLYDNNEFPPEEDD